MVEQLAWRRPTGCNYQAPNWVFGVETDMSAPGPRRSTTDTNVPPFFR
jgi:hypothetical protein